MSQSGWLRNLEIAGQYRALPVRIAGTRRQPPEPWEVSRLMDEWG